MTTKQAEIIMSRRMEQLELLRQERDYFRGSNDFVDMIRAQSLDSRIGEIEDDVAFLENEHPRAAQNIANG